MEHLIDTRDTKGDRRHPASAAEVTEVLNVGSVSAEEASSGQLSDSSDLGVFLDRLAAAGADRCTGLAKAQIHRCIEAGADPPGLRRLAEALAASVAEPPGPRLPVDEPRSVVTAVRDNNLLILEDFEPDAVAAAVAALLADGRRVIVTATARRAFTTVRDAMPEEAVNRSIDKLPALRPAELRELRLLLATSTPERRARSEQRLPPVGALPPIRDVAELCGQLDSAMGEQGQSLVVGLVGELDPERRAAVTSVADWVKRSLDALRPRDDQAWTWALLSDLIYSRHRATFDRVLEESTQIVEVFEAAGAAPQVTLGESLPDTAVEMLLSYLEFMESGGRSRSCFRSAAQRDVLPVFRQIRLDGRAPATVADVRLILRHLEIGERLERVGVGCAEMGIPVPRDADELTELVDGLVKVSAAARSVGELRHEVLFLHPDSPLAVPDVTAAEQIAVAILGYSGQAPVVEAEQRLDEMATELAAHATVPATAPEHEQAVTALRERDCEAYAAAVDGLAAARRESDDESRRTALLERLRSGAPRLAAAWSGFDEDRAGGAGLGMACFLPVAKLLSALPPADTADVVLVLGVAQMGVERLLLTAVAPRFIAVVGPGEPTKAGSTVLSVLRRAATLVIRGGSAAPNGRMVQMDHGARPAPQTRAHVG